VVDVMWRFLRLGVAMIDSHTLLPVLSCLLAGWDKPETGNSEEAQNGTRMTLI
jgi:hypothetical protein